MVMMCVSPVPSTWQTSTFVEPAIPVPTKPGTPPTSMANPVTQQKKKKRFFILILLVLVLLQVMHLTNYGNWLSLRRLGHDLAYVLWPVSLHGEVIRHLSFKGKLELW